MESKEKRVLSVAPLPPEKCAYALARYSRSPDSIRQSMEWVRTHNAQSFLESFYFQYGHASIADLGHTVLCFEGISELAASEIEDEALWDGQAKSSRYQDFGKGGYIVPGEFDDTQGQAYRQAAEKLLEGYRAVHARAGEHLRERLPRPGAMKPEAYARNIAARAFDVARYLLFWGVPTNVGQVTSIRTLEKQIRRLRVSPYKELREIAEEISGACAAAPDCLWDGAECEPLAPTLARHAEPDVYRTQCEADLRAWAEENLTLRGGGSEGGLEGAAGEASSRAADGKRVELTRPADTASDIAATLLYTVTDRPYRELYEMVRGWSEARRNEVLSTAVRSRAQRDELPRAFGGGPYVFDMAIDIGAYRDLHRHRRCHQFRQAYSGGSGYELPEAVTQAGVSELYRAAMEGALRAMKELPAPGRDYLLPFGARSRFLFKMDFAEAEYIARVRSGVKGHFSYREAAWQMKQAMEELEPGLGRLMQATPPWVEDPLQR